MADRKWRGLFSLQHSFHVATLIEIFQSSLRIVVLFEERCETFLFDEGVFALSGNSLLLSTSTFPRAKHRHSTTDDCFHFIFRVSFFLRARPPRAYGRTTWPHIHMESGTPLVLYRYAFWFTKITRTSKGETSQTHPNTNLPSCISSKLWDWYIVIDSLFKSLMIFICLVSRSLTWSIHRSLHTSNSYDFFILSRADW